MCKVQLLVSALLLVLLLAACAPQAVPAPASAPAALAPAPAPAPAPAALAPAAPAKAAWEVEWENVLSAAKKEGVVTYAFSAGRLAETELSRRFRDKFGIRTESGVGVGGTLAAKILTERRAGLYLWDIFLDGAGAQTSVFKPGGGTVPMDSTLIVPDLTDPEVIKKVWYGGQLPWVDKAHHMLAALSYVEIFVAINTTLVKPGEIKTFDDLLDPRWKGKILFMDPTVPGKMDASLMVFLYEVKGENWVRKLAQQGALVIGDDRLATDWLAHGKYPIYLTPRPENYMEFVKAGAPIGIVDTEDISSLESGSSCISLIGNAPHLNAAKAYINFYLSKEGQTIMSQAWGGPSARLDVPTEGLLPAMLLKPGRNYWIKTREEVVLKVADYRTKSKEVFAHLLK